MKGLELPINTLIIIVIGLVILLALIAILFGGFNIARPQMSLETAKNDACRQLSTMGCDYGYALIPVNNFDANRNGKVNDPTIHFKSSIGDDCGAGALESGDNLATLCLCFYNMEEDKECKKNVCGCTISGGPPGPPG